MWKRVHEIILWENDGTQSLSIPTTAVRNFFEPATNKAIVRPGGTPGNDIVEHASAQIPTGHFFSIDVSNADYLALQYVGKPLDVQDPAVDFTATDFFCYANAIMHSGETDPDFQTSIHTGNSFGSAFNDMGKLGLSFLGENNQLVTFQPAGGDVPISRRGLVDTGVFNPTDTTQCGFLLGWPIATAQPSSGATQIQMLPTVSPLARVNVQLPLSLTFAGALTSLRVKAKWTAILFAETPNIQS